MTEDEQTVLLLRGAIASLGKTEKEEAEAAYLQIKQIADCSDAAKLGLALVGAELSAAVKD